MSRIASEVKKGGKSASRTKRTRRMRRNLWKKRVQDLQLKNYLLESHPEFDG